MTSQLMTFLKIRFNYSRDDLIGNITTPLQTNSAHRVSDISGVHCYFGSRIRMIPANLIQVYNNVIV